MNDPTAPDAAQTAPDAAQTSRVRLAPDQRREIIVQAALRLTRDRHGSTLGWTRADVAAACEVPTSADTVKEYFTMSELREAVEERIGTA